MKNKIQQRGFTLIELLVVIVILGILSTISVGTFRSYFAKARDSERVSTVQNIAMMMKVDSGGHGDCTVYNYADSPNPVGGACDVDVEATLLKSLLEDNDYSMPDEKNGLAYFYGYKVGATDGDNNFFVIIGAEEDNPQNGKPMKTTTGAGVADSFSFIDGTTKGIEAFTTTGAAITPGCFMASGSTPDCTAGAWVVYLINSDGEIAIP